MGCGCGCIGLGGCDVVGGGSVVWRWVRIVGELLGGGDEVAYCWGCSRPFAAVDVDGGFAWEEWICGLDGNGLVASGS